MSTQGYTRVTESSFLTFPEKLEASEVWSAVGTADVSLKSTEGVEQLMASSTLVTLKTLVTSAVEALRAASQETRTAIMDADDTWDRLQGLLHQDLERESQSEDGERSAAAALLREELLKGGTTAQTQFSYGDEIQFARAQIARAEKPEVAAAVARLGLAERLQAVSQATERFATLIEEAGDDRPRPLQRRRAWRACASAFSLTHEFLTSLVRHLPAAGRRHLIEYLAPFEAILAEEPIPLSAQGAGDD